MRSYFYHTGPDRELNLLYWQRSSNLHLHLDRECWFLRPNQLHCTPVHSINACFEFDPKHGRFPVPRPFRCKQHPPNFHLGRHPSGHLPGKSLRIAGRGRIPTVLHDILSPSHQRPLLILPLHDNSSGRSDTLGQPNKPDCTDSGLYLCGPDLDLQLHLYYHRHLWEHARFVLCSSQRCPPRVRH